MSYSIIRTNGSLLTTIPDGVVNTTSTPLSLPGRNYASYGQIVDTNFVRSLENFADTAPPSNALKGQLWYDTTPDNEGLYICPSDGATDPNVWIPILTPNTVGNLTLDNLTANANIRANNANITNSLDANVISTNYLTVNVQANIANANITGSTVLTNVRTANISTGANTTPGNLTGTWALNGTLTSNGNITASGIKTDNWYYANGTAVSFDGTYTNSNVAAYLPTYIGNVGAEGSSTVFNGRTLTTGADITTGTIIGNWTLGAGSKLNGISGVDGANIIGIVANANFASTADIANTVRVNNQPNITTVGTLTSLNVNGPLSVTGTSNLGPVGNVTITGGSAGQVLSTNGSGGLSWVSASAADTAITVIANAQPNITSVGTLTNLSVSGNATIGNNISGANVSTGRLTATGNVSFSGSNVSLGSNATVRITGGSAGQVLSTNGSGGLSWVSAAAADTAITVTANAQPNITSVGTLTSLSVTGNVDSGNVSATDVSATTLGGTLTTALQPNITSVGTLQGLTVSGAAQFGGGIVNLGSVGNLRIAGGTSGQVLLSTGAGGVAWGTTGSAADTAITVTGNAQPNITSVGTLASLAVSGSGSFNNVTVQQTISAGNVNGVAATFSGLVNLGSVANVRIAGGTFGQVLQATGTGGVAWSTPSPFPAGTRMLFVQSSAPTGWTKETTDNNAALRVVSGSAGSGGSVDFTTAFSVQSTSGSVGSTTVSGTVGSTSVSGTIGATSTGGTVGETALNVDQMPAHDHYVAGGAGGSANVSANGTIAWTSRNTSGNQDYDLKEASSTAYIGKTSTTGSGQAHGHSFTGASHSHSFTSPLHSHGFTSPSHSHTFSGSSINLAVKYVDTIIARKD